MRINYFFGWILSLLVCNFTNAEIINLQGKIQLISGSMPTNVALRQLADESFQESTPITAAGDFNFKINAPSPGLYTIRINQFSYDLIINPAEKIVKISMKWQDGKPLDIKTEDSKENEAYRNLLQIKNFFFEDMKATLQSCKDVDTCNQKLKTALHDNNSNIEMLISKNKETFTAQKLAPILLIKEDEKSTMLMKDQLKNYWFDLIDLQDPDLFTTNIFISKFNFFVEELMPNSKPAAARLIQQLVSKIANENKNKTKMAALIFNNFYFNQREDMLKAFLEWYGKNKAHITNEALKMRMENIGSVLSGNVMIDFESENEKNEKVKLSKVVSNQKYTLLVFWASTCYHCTEEIPKIKALYETYRTKGLTVFAASLDSDETAWKEFIRTQNLTWENVRIADGTKSNVVNKYAVNLTPTLILIKNDGLITKRFATLEQLEDVFKNELK